MQHNLQILTRYDTFAPKTFLPLYRCKVRTLWTTATEQQCVDRNTGRVLPLGVNDRTLASRTREAGVWMSSSSRHSLLPFLSEPRRHFHLLTLPTNPLLQYITIFTYIERNSVFDN